MPTSIADIVDQRARATPDAVAILTEDARMTWREYARRSDRLARLLVAQGLEAGDRVAVLLPDGPGAHAAYVGIEKAGLVCVGIGPRAGDAELTHLVEKGGARALLSRPDVAPPAGVHHVVIEDELESLPDFEADLDGRRPGPDDVFLLNSTSGTTGMPKCVVHDQRRWLAFHELAVPAGALSEADVFLSALPTPFGFGLWTAHFTPALLGVPVAVMPRFDAALALDLIERERVSVLAAVSTQFIMMLNTPGFDDRDLSSLRVLFTGGEAVPYERAFEFEERSGAAVLQFYGSNETGAVSGTTLDDPREKRLRTAGRPIPAMQLRLFDAEGRDVTEGGRGQPGCKGPTLSRGYHGDEAANAKLWRDDGWMLLGDVAELDADGYLNVIGRSDDFIIRGGKNVSAVAVEEAVASHPAVALAAAVAMPDAVFGERVCAYVELRPGAAPGLDLEALTAHLRDRGTSVETWPERLVVLDVLPRGSGGKVAKGELRRDIRNRLRTEEETPNGR